MDIRQRISEYDLASFIQRDGVQLAPYGSRRLVGLCPFHDDRDPSLVVWLDPGRGWFCFGCQRGGDAVAYVQERRPATTFREALAILGIEPGPSIRLQPPPPRAPARVQPSSPGELVATYDYRDAAGELVYQVLRYKRADGSKTFRQRRPDGKGGWIWNLAGVEAILYRLPELVAGDQAETVFVVEGEKDADRLAALGLVAITSSGGAGHWPDAESRHLAGRQVAILPDNDEAGRQHAGDVAASLRGIAASVKIVELPGLEEKGDVSDWLALKPYHTADALRMLADMAKELPEVDPETGEIAGDEECREELDLIAAQLLATRAELDGERALHEQTKAELARRDEHIRWTHDMLSRPNVKPAALITAYFLRWEVEWKQRKDGVASVRVYLPALAEKSGQSASMVGRHLKTLDELGWLTRNTITVTHTGGTRQTQIFVEPELEFFERPRQLPPAPERNHGGERPRCKKCNSVKLVTAAVRCQDCGHLQPAAGATGVQSVAIYIRSNNGPTNSMTVEALTDGDSPAYNLYDGEWLG